ncbi:MAG: aggregation factor core [Pseudomonadota bacterium]
MRAFALCFALIAAPAAADIRVDFIEGAPKDRFVILNTSACALDAFRIEIDLTGSAGALVFDTTEAGQGVEVFQPFDLVDGADLVAEVPTVNDGDQMVALALTGLGPDQSVAFTIDVDDTLGAREITVSRSEIVGAAVRVGTDVATFDASSVAQLPVTSCAA